MAKIVSPVWSWIRGSIAGTTYFTLTSGAIIGRQRVKPVQPNSLNQSWAKNAMTSAVALWTQATADLRAAWNAWALANPPGSGRQQFIAGQAFQMYGFLSEPTGWPPLVFDTHEPDFSGHPTMSITPITFTDPAQTGIAVSVKNSSPHTVAVIVERSIGLSGSRYFWKGPWDPRESKGAAMTATTTQDFKWSGLVEGQHYFVRVRCVVTSGDVGHRGRVVSTPLIVMCTGTANP